MKSTTSMGIIARITHLEQENGDKKRIGFEIIRKVTRSTQHNWDMLTRTNISFDKEETDRKEIRLGR